MCSEYVVRMPDSQNIRVAKKITPIYRKAVSDAWEYVLVWSIIQPVFIHWFRQKLVSMSQGSTFVYKDLKYYMWHDNQPRSGRLMRTKVVLIV